jgi:glycosyltransferase involved in cell wall biosynthesis
MGGTPRVLLVAEHASAEFGGEAMLPLHHFRVLRRRGVEAWMIVHERTRAELLVRFAADQDRLCFIPDTPGHRMVWRAGAPLPARLAEPTFGQALRLLSQRAARRLARTLVRMHAIDVVHQPIPVSPKEPSLLYDLGAPLVVGPLNGGMSFPPGFRRLDPAGLRPLIGLGRRLAHLGNRALPGKLRADTVLVANERTRRALPAGVRGRVIELVENGVDLALWSPATRPPANGPARFLFLGRLCDWKAVDVLLDALARAGEALDAGIDVVGDGPERPALEARTVRLGLAGRVRFHGWLPQEQAAARLRAADALLLPSVYECGGAVVLEAMACGLPVVATDWGGPADYLDASCGVLVAPASRDQLVAGFAEAMLRLGRSPELRRRLGTAGRERVVARYDWERKVDRMLEIYGDAAARHRRGRGPEARAVAA